MRYLFLVLMYSAVHADFNAAIDYKIVFPNASMWGIGNSAAIANNKGKQGVVTGTSVSCGICPCLAYGVTPWQAATSIPYSYSVQQEKAVAVQQKQAGEQYDKQSCIIVQNPTVPTISMTNVLEQAYEFVSTMGETLTELVNMFPDVTQGQGYESTVFLNFCIFPTTLSERINTINTNFFGWGLYENYFLNKTFVLALDLTNLVPLGQEIQNGNAFANAVINRYCHSFKIQAVSSALASNIATHNAIIDDAIAVKNALLW